MDRKNCTFTLILYKVRFNTDRNLPGCSWCTGSPRSAWRGRRTWWGSWPRHFALQDNILVTTDQHGDSAQIVHVDSQGLLLPGGTFNVEEKPAFVTFI